MAQKEIMAGAELSKGADTRNGAQKIQQLKDLGYTDDEIAKWKEDTVSKLIMKGFGEEDINSYFEVSKVNFSSIDNEVKEGYKRTSTGDMVPEDEDVGLITAFRRGYRGSITGMVTAGQAPVGLAEDEDIWDHVAYGLAETLGDSPVSIPSFFVGAVPGAKAGGAIGTAGGAGVGALFGGVGAGPGAAIGGTGGAVIGGATAGGATSGFVTGATREALIQFYRENPGANLMSLDYLARFGSALLSEEAVQQGKFEGTLGGILGVGSPIARGVAKPAAKGLKNPVAKKVVEEGTVTAAEIGLTVATISAMTGEFPNSKDFGIAAGMVLSFKAGEASFKYVNSKRNSGARAAQESVVTGMNRVIKKNDIGIVEKNLQDIYVRTGLRPEEIVEMAQKDPQLRQAILTDHDKVSDMMDQVSQSVTDPTSDAANPKTVEDTITVNSEMVSPETFANVQAADTAHSKMSEVTRPEIDRDVQAREDVLDEILRDMEVKTTEDVQAREEMLDAQKAEDVDLTDMTVQEREAALDETLGRAERTPEDVQARENMLDKLTGKEDPTPDESKIILRDDFGLLPQEGVGDGGPPRKPPTDLGPAKDLPPEGPERIKILRDLEADKKAIGDMVRQQQRRRYTMNDFRYDFINDLQFMVSEPADAFRAETGKKLSIEENPGELARLAAGAHAKAERDIKLGIFDIQRNKDGSIKSATKVSDGLEEILKRVPKKEQTDFRDYLIAKRMVEKADQGFPMGENVAAARNVAQAGDKNPAFVRAANEMQHWQDSGVKQLVESGLMSKDRAEQMIDLNRDYVPFFRLMYDKETPKGVSARGIPVRNPVKKFKGSDLNILDPMEVMVKNRYTLQQMADNNIARQRLVEFNSKLSEENQFIEKVGEPKKVKDPITDLEIEAEIPSKAVRPAEEVPTGEFRGWLEANGMDPKDAPEFASFYQRSKNLRKDEFIVYENGRPVVYRAKNPDLVRSLQAMNPAEQNQLIKLLAVPSSIMRSGTVLAPDFIIRATVRDQLSSVLLNTFKVVPIGDAIIGIKSLIKKDKEYLAWLNAGGANSALLEMDRQILTHSQMDRIDPTWKAKAWNAAATPYRALAYASTMMENSMRLGQFKRSIKKGESFEVAGLRARDVSLDFHRMGARVRQYNRISAFLGATINGIDRTMASFKNFPKATFIKGTAMLTIPSLALYMLNREEEWYQDLPEWEKSTFWHFPIGDPKDIENFKIVRVPMPIIYGQVFAYGPTATLDAYLNDKPDQVEEISKEILKSMWVNPTPVAVTPLVEVGFNMNMMTGNPLVSRSTESMLPQYRYTPYTTETAKRLSELLGEYNGAVPDRFRSPIAMEHIIGGYTGSIGRQGMQILDAALQEVGFVKEGVKPEKDWDELPFIRNFFSRYPSASRALDDFYKNAEAADQVQRTVDAFIQQGRIEEANHLMAENIGLMTQTRTFRRTVANIQNLIRGTHYDKNMGPEEKKQIIDDYMVLLNDTAKMYNKLFEELKSVE